MKAKLYLIMAMLIFGSIGLFVRGIDISSSQIAFSRGITGSLVLIITSVLIKNKLSWNSIQSNLILLIASGAAIGFNWIFLFEAYKYTTIANATLSYYFAPVFVMILAPMVLKEKLRRSNILSILGAMIGMFLILDMGNMERLDSGNIKGILFGLLAASLYACVILINKFLKNLSGLETTIIQLFFASIVLLPYILATEKVEIHRVSSASLIILLFLGLIHTGVAYLLYFTALKQLKGQTIAVYSYIDPIAAILLSSIFLRESMTPLKIVGGILILGATFLNELHK